MAENILTNGLLQSANLSNKHQQITKVTLPELWCDSMKDQTKKTFSDSSWHILNKDEGFIKLRTLSLWLILTSCN